MIFLSLLVLFISISAVSADGNLTALETQIEKSTDSFEITQDYAYSPTVDANYTIGAFVNKTNFVINGNGHTIDGKNQSRLFRIANANVTVNDLIIKNGFSSDFGGGIFSQCDGLILNNVTFINDNAKFVPKGNDLWFSFSNGHIQLYIHKYNSKICACNL